MDGPLNQNNLSSELSRQLQIDGYALIPQFRCSASTLKVASDVGRVIDLEVLLPGSRIPTVQTLTPRKESEAPESLYSGVFGLSEFPLHSDLAHWAVPPRYFMLRCIHGANDVATKLLPASVVVSTIGHAILQRALVKPRRASRYGNVGLLPLLFFSGQTNGLRWDSLFLTPMSAAARDVMDFMTGSERTWNERKEIILVRPGDTLIVDNWRMLHGRSDAVAGPKRIIERVYLSEIVL